MINVNAIWFLIKHGWLTGVIPAAVGFAIGMAVWRNNSVKFKKIESKLGEKVNDLIK